MYSAYKLNKQGDNIQPWHTPFPVWNQSVVPCSVLTVASWPAYKFLKRHVRWSGIPISCRIFQFFVIHTVKGFGVVNKAEVDVSLELSCFFDDPTDVGNLISDSSAFSKSSLNMWKFTVHLLLKPGLENFEHYFTTVWDECTSAAVWAFFGIGPAIILLGFYPKELTVYGQGKTCTWMFIVTLFIIAKMWKQTRYSSVSKWMNKLWYIHTMDIINQHHKKMNY